MRHYHDYEWGVPVTDDRKQFEFLVLESAQAGLSWSTILNKRENYRKAFAGFDPVKVAKFGILHVKKLMNNAGIIRNRLKIEASVNNAQKFLEVQKEFGSFSNYIWDFTGGKPQTNCWKTLKNLPPKTELSDALSKDLKKRGFKFLGSTVLYSHMQAVGLVNDHLTTCFRYKELKKKHRKFKALMLFIFVSFLCFPLTSYAGKKEEAQKKIEVLNGKVKAAGEKGDLQEAITSAEEALQVANKEIGEKSIEAAKALNNVANLYMFAEHPLDAERLYKKAILIEAEHYDKNGAEIADSYYNLGIAYAVQKKFTEARKILDKAYKIRVEKLGRDHPETKKTRQTIDEIWAEST